MQIAFIGLGRMGSGMVRRLHAHGHGSVVFDRSAEAVRDAVRTGAVGAESTEDLLQQIRPPRLIWLMVPHTSVDAVLGALLHDGTEAGDLIADGGNSDFRDSRRRWEMLERRGIEFADIGTSGGLGGAESGYSLTVGGTAAAYARLTPSLDALAAPGGCMHVGPPGSGHFAKLVHNAIEYGVMAAFAEGLELLARGPYEKLELQAIAEVWNNGGILRSYLLEAARKVLLADPTLSAIAGYAEDTGLGRWAVREALDRDIPLHVISSALYNRSQSRQQDSFAAKFIAVLRHEFGGHELQRIS